MEIVSLLNVYIYIYFLSFSLTLVDTLDTLAVSCVYNYLFIVKTLI